MSNTFPLVVSALFLGMGIGVGISGFVTDHNAEFNAAKYRKELVDLGVGYYDARTGGFNTKACTK